jgi:hypothetical protein
MIEQDLALICLNKVSQPINPVILPFLTSKQALFTALIPPKLFDKFVAWSKNSVDESNCT